MCFCFPTAGIVSLSFLRCYEAQLYSGTVSYTSCVSMGPKHGKRKLVMGTAKLRRTFQIWLKGYDSLVSFFFFCLFVFTVIYIKGNRKNVMETLYRIYKSANVTEWKKKDLRSMCMEGLFYCSFILLYFFYLNVLFYSIIVLFTFFSHLFLYLLGFRSTGSQSLTVQHCINEDKPC